MTSPMDALNTSTFELANAGMACLTERFGVVGAEAFIALILRERMDYTEWRRSYYDAMLPGEFHEKALSYAKEHPYHGNAQRL